MVETSGISAACTNFVHWEKNAGNNNSRFVSKLVHASAEITDPKTRLTKNVTHTSQHNSHTGNKKKKIYTGVPSYLRVIRSKTYRG
jgi:hypothetical protein